MSEENKEKEAELIDVLKILNERKALKKALEEIPPTYKEEFKGSKGKIEESK